MILPDRVVVPPAIELAEPMTTITDWLLAAICLVCAVRVGRSIGSENRVTGWFWCGAFVATAVAAMAGGRGTDSLAISMPAHVTRSGIS
jgi:uncharacterized protein DUF6962